MFSAQETIYLLLLIGISIRTLILSLQKKDIYDIWNPINFFTLFFTYYIIIGPILSVYNETTFFRNVEHREYLLKGWQCSLVSFISVIAGYATITKINIRKLQFDVNNVYLKKIGIRFFILSCVVLVAFAGSGVFQKVNFLSGQSSSLGYKGVFSNYLMQALNFFITASCLFLVYYLRTKKFVWFLVVFFITASLFINEAFRYRLVLLILSSLSIFYLVQKKKPNFILLGSLGILFIFFMGLIEFTRSYGKGLDVDRLDGYENEDILLGGFNESAVFLASAYLVTEVDNGYLKQTREEMFYNAIVSPIPRKIWRGKPEGEYFLGTMGKIYDRYSTGQAMLYWSEYYLSYGWAGLITLSVLLGILFKRVWLWYLNNKDNHLAIVAIAIFNSYIYVIISRGYLSQVLTLFFFTVVPAFYLITFIKKRLQTN